MPKIIRVSLTSDQLDDLNARARRHDLTPRERERLEMIRLSHLGVTIPQIAAHLDRHPQTVRRIIRGFVDAGFAILPDQPRPGRPATLTDAVLAAVEQRLDADATATIAGHLRAKFDLLFDELRIAGNRELVERFVTAVPVARPLPAALGGGAGSTVMAGASVFDDDGSGE